MEKNLATLLLRYLDASEQAVKAKRGRDVSTYVSRYEECQQIESFIQALLVRMNSLYLDQVLQAFLGYKKKLTNV